MKRSCILTTLTLLLIAFVPVTSSCEGEGASPTPVPTATQALTPVLPTSQPTFATASPGPTETYVPAKLTLRIAEPQSGNEVSTSAVISGYTLPNAVVSIMVDDHVLIADVNLEGYFSVAVTLDEGPNYIEVVASDPEGNTVYTSFPVIGIP